LSKQEYAHLRQHQERWTFSDLIVEMRRLPTDRLREDQIEPEFLRCVAIQRRFKYLLGLKLPGGAQRNRVLNKGDFLKLRLNLPALLSARSNRDAAF
jgi:hypothetical protein